MESASTYKNLAVKLNR